MRNIDILVIVREADTVRYHQNLSMQEGFTVQAVGNPHRALAMLADLTHHTDVVVIDNNLPDVHLMVRDLRQKYPRLIIVLVDEEADFGLPGQADDISTEPFHNDDLARRITRMMSDRQLETLRSDSLPAVRNIAKRLRTATGVRGKQEAAVLACKEMGYDYVAYYHLERLDPFRMTLYAQNGPTAIQSIAPKQASLEDLMGWVSQNGQSRIAGPEDRPNHPLVARGRLGAIACIPVSVSGNNYGVIAACRDRPNSITQENVLMLELVCTQLASALSKEQL
ncbi:MAG: GAF domain-containing protein [bacterium]|nr:GAF domain-containing protein [bacterium]